MLGKRVLNFIGTFLLGSHLISIVGAVDPVEIELKACSEYEGFDSTICENSSAATAYCIEGNKVYGVNGNAENACKENSAFKLTENTLNIVNPSKKQNLHFFNADAAETALSALENPENFVLVVCDDGDPAVCKQTQGYIIKDTDHVYSFAGFKVGKEIHENTELVKTSILSGDGCEIENIGMLITDSINEICVEKDKSVKFDNTDLNYHVVSGKLATGTPLEDENTVVLKITDKYIIKDKLNPVPESVSIEECPSEPGTCTANSKPHGYFCIWGTSIYSYSSDNACRSGTELSLVGNKLNLVRIDGSLNYADTQLNNKIDGLVNPDGYILVDCVSSTCKQVSGYLKNASSIYKFIDTKVGALASDVVDGSITLDGSCSGKVGKVSTDLGSICVNSERRMSFSVATEEFMIMKGEGVEGTPFKNDDYDVILKSGDKYIIKDPHFNDVCVTNVKNNIVTISSNVNDLSSTVNYKLFDCKDGNCKQTQGYVMKDSSSIYAFVGNEVGETISGKARFLGNPAISESLRVDAISKCTVDYNGKIFIYSSNAVGICIVYKDHTGADKNIGIDIAAPSPGGKSEFLILKGTAAVGTPFENKNEDIAVKRTGKYIIRDQFINSVNLFNKIDHSIVNTANDFDAANSGLITVGTQKNYYIYDCQDGKCRQTSGYIKSGGDVIAFIGEGSGGHEAPAITEVDGSCAVEDIGLVTMSKDGICYSDTSTISFDSGEPRYIMLKGKAVNRTPFNDNVNSVVIKRGEAYIVRDKFYTALNMVKNDGTIEKDYTGNVDLSGYVVVDCKEGVCRQSFGYVKNKRGVYNFVKEYVGTEFISSTITDETKCEDEIAGLLYNDKKGICITEGKGINFGDDDENEYMILKGKTYGERNPFEEAAKINIRIMRSANYILKDNFYTSVTLVNKVDGTYTTDFATPNAGLAETPSDYAVVDCNDGNCIQTQGYVVNNGKGFAFIEEEFGAKVGETLKASSCSADKVGKILGDLSGVCIGNGSSAMAFNADGAEYIVMKGSAVEGTPFEEVDEILAVKRTANYIIRDYFYSNVNMMNKVDGSVKTDFSRTIPGLATTPSNYVVVECLEGRCKQTQGYVKNGNAVYAFVGENGGKKTENVQDFVGASAIDASSCSETNGGRLIKDNEGICYPASGQTIKFEDSEGINIMMEGTAAANTPFEDKVNGISIKQSANYILKDAFYTEVNLFDPITGKVKTDLRNALITDITGSFKKLVDCVDGICKQTSGYVIGHYIMLNFEGDNDGKYDNNVNKVANCNGEVGKYVVGTEVEVGVCIKDVGDPIDFSDRTKNIKHLIKTAAESGTPFNGATLNVLLKHGADYFIIDKFESVNLFDSSTQEVYSDFDTVDFSDPSIYNIVDCVNGVCKFTSGYIKSGNKIYEFINDGVGHDGSSLVAAGVTETSGCIKDHVGKHFTDAKGRTSVCITVGHSINMVRKRNYMIMAGTAITGTPFIKDEFGVAVKGGKGYVVIDRFNSNVNIVKAEDGTSTADLEIMHVGLASNPSKYVIVDCINGQCKQTSGYIINNDNVYSFVKNNGGSVVTSSTVVTSIDNVKNCGDQHVGKFIKTKGAMCYSSGKGIVLEAPAPPYGEMIIEGMMPENTPFADSTSPIKHGKNFIIKDVLYDLVVTPTRLPACDSFKSGFTEDDCTLENVEDVVAVTYCIHDDDNKIYVVKAIYQFECYKDSLSAGDYYFKKINDETFVKKENNDEGDIDVHYTCNDDGECKIIEPDEVLEVLYINVKDGRIEPYEIVLTNGNIGNYKIVQCDKEKQKCVQTNGYVKVSDEYYAFIKNDVGKPATLPDPEIAVEGCEGEGATKNVGQIFKETTQGVCVNTKKGIKFGDSVTNVMILKSTPAIENTPFRDTENNVVIKSGANFIIIDKYYSGVNLVNTVDGTIKTEDDFSSDLTKYVLIYCIDSICKETEGYVIVNNLGYAYHGGVKGVAVADSNYVKNYNTYSSTISEAGQCTKDSYIGRLYSDTETGVCLEEAIGVAISANADDKKYIIDGAAESAKGTPFENNSHVILKVTGDYIIKDVFYNSGEYCTYTDNATREVKKSKICKKNVLGESGEFYICENGLCTEKVDGTNEVENGNYVLSVNGQEKMFKCAKGHCWAKKYNGMYVIETRDNVEKVVLDDAMLDALDGILDKEITLNDCVKGVCNPTEGFIRYGVGNYIAEITNDGTRTVTDYAKCKNNAADNGKLLKNMDLCIDGSDDVGISRAITGVGLIYTGNRGNGNGGGSGIGSDYTVTCTEHNGKILCDQPIKFKKCDSSGSKYECNKPSVASGICIYDDNNDKIYCRKGELLDYNVECRGDNQLYCNELIIGTMCWEDVDGYECENLLSVISNKIGEKQKYIGIKDPVGCVWTDEDENIICDENIVGAQCKYISEGDNNGKYNCQIGDDFHNYYCSFKGIMYFEKYTNIIGDDSRMRMNLYQRTGANVVGAVLDGNYVYDDKTVIQCDRSSGCGIMDDEGFAGYLLNADYNTNKEKPLIYCTSKDDCSIQPKEANGYYLFKRTDNAEDSYVECDNKGCVSKPRRTIETNSCESHGYKIIYDNTYHYKFCSSSATTPKSITSGYEIISGTFAPGKLFNYPTNMGNIVEREILIKMTTYSVTALTGDAIPIGYVKVNNGYLECQYDDDGKKMCKEADVSGTACTVPGKLYTSGERVHLCVKPDENPEKVIDIDEVNFDGPAVYVLPLGDGIFGIKKRTDANYYISVKIDNGSIIVNKEPTLIKYKYTESDATSNTTLYLIFSKTEAVTLNATGEITKEKLIEFQLKQWSIGSDGNKDIDYYTESN